MRISTRTKLFLMGAIPALALIVFAFLATQDKLKLANEMKQLQSLVQLSVRIGELSHELQKERGLSAGFISSKGASNIKELPEQRQQTDQKIDELRKALADFNFKQYHSDLELTLSAANQALGSLDSKRQAITNLQLTASDSAAYYTSAISSFLKIPAIVSTLSSNGEIAQLSAAYSSLLQAKERAGRERAILAAAFTLNQFTPATFSGFLQNLSAQQVYFDEFFHYASPEQKAFYEVTHQGDAVKETMRLRQAAIDSSETLTLAQDPGQWFKVATGRIEKLKEVENHLADDLLLKQNNLRTQAQLVLTLYLLFAIVAIVITAMLIFYVSRSILRQLGGEPSKAASVALAVSQGDMSTVIKLKDKDTSSVMFAMHEMQEVIKIFIAEQNQMAEQHAQGWISSQMDAAKFKGSFAVMAKESNALVNSHIEVQNQIVEVITEYSRGNFTPNMPQLPGDKAKITTALQNVKSALLAISNDVKMLAESGSRGDFSQRADAKKYEFMFQEMIQNLNQLTETCDVGFNDVLRVSNALAAGDLTQTICKDYPGLFGQTKNGVNATVAALEKVISEIEQTVEAAANKGDFSVKINLSDKQGYTLRLSELLNQLSTVTDTGLRDVMRVANALADGDLTKTITQDYPGLFGETKQGVNATVENLQRLVSEIQYSGASINTAAKEISQGNADLSRRTEAQAASLEETASSMEELTSTVKQNAENATVAT